MKKVVFRSSVFIVLFAMMTMSLTSQISVKKAESNSISSSAIGFYYSLPQTVLKVDIVYEKVQSLEGPLSSFADEYLGVKDYISSDRTEYNLLNADVSSFIESDNDQIYFVQFPAERTKDAAINSFQLSDIGGLLAYNTDVTEITKSAETTNENVFIFNEGDADFPLVAQYNKRKKTDTVLRTINIDTVVINRFLFKTSWVDKNDSDKAKEAALQIEKLRESRYNLISGYQEVNYGSSIIYMDAKLKELEKQYLELFTGKTIKTVHSKTVYIVPDANNSSKEIMSFNDGKSVVFRITEKETTELQEAPKSTVNNIYYRIPASASFEISMNNVNYFSGRLTINQLGNVATVPLADSKLIFDPETGNLVKLIK